MEPLFPVSSHLEGAIRIGAGGCGIVYASEHAKWGKVAVKVATGADAEMRRLFHSEFTILRSLRHRAILKAYDFFLLADQQPVIVLQLCDGGDFYQVADKLEAKDRFRSLGQVLSALEYLHLLGIIHRDLKGENILLSRDQGAQLSDLGLAAAADAEMRERGGTLEYMAPEVIDNRGATAESDIYSLGVILYRLATGRLPFISSDPLQIVSRKQEPDAIPFDELANTMTPRFAKLVRQCIDPAPADRPKSIKDVAEQLLLDNLITAGDFGTHHFDDFFHHYIYSYNASFCRQELKAPSDRLQIEHFHQAVAGELESSISDHLKLQGKTVSTAGSSIRFSDEQSNSSGEIWLVNRALKDTAAASYGELDRFAFDATLAKLIPKEVDPATADLIFELSSGNLALMQILLRQLEREKRFEIRSGKLRLEPLEIFTFEPDQAYFELAKEMLPGIAPECRDVAGFLATDSGSYPLAELLALGRVSEIEVNALTNCGFLEAGSIARGYYRSYVRKTLDRAAAQRNHLGWIKVVEETDELPPLVRERMFFEHYRGAGYSSSAGAAALRLAELLRESQKLEDAESLLAFACKLPDIKNDLPLYVNLLNTHAALLNAIGDFDGALGGYSAVVRYGIRSGDKEAVATAYKRAGDVYKAKRDYRRGNRALDRAVRFYGEQGDELELSHCYNNIGNISWINGDLVSAASNYEKALAIQRRLDAKRDIASSLSNLGSLRCIQQDFAAGIGLFKESIEIKKQLNDLPELARTYNNLSVAYFEQDELVTAQDYLKQAFEINKSIGASAELLYNYDNFYEIEFRRGNFAKAREWLIEGLKNSHRDAHSARGGFINSLAGLSLLAGKFGKAGTLLAAAHAREEKVTDRTLSMMIAATNSEYYRTLLDFGNAYDYVQIAIEHAQKMGESKAMATFLIRRARIERAIERPYAEIAQTLAEARDLLEHLPVRREKLELILETAELAFGKGEYEEVDRLLTEAVNYPDFDGVITQRAKLYDLRGRFELQRGNINKAILLLNDSVLAAKSLDTPEVMWQILLRLGDAYRSQNQLERALKSYIEAFNTVKGLAGQITDKRLRKLYVADSRKKGLAKRLEEMSSLVA